MWRGAKVEAAAFGTDPYPLSPEVSFLSKHNKLTALPLLPLNPEPAKMKAKKALDSGEVVCFAQNDQGDPFLHVSNNPPPKLNPRICEELCGLMDAGGRRIEEYDAYASLCGRPV